MKKKRDLVREKCGDKCYYCDRVFTDWNKFDVDHVIPKSKGGTSDISNLVLACKKCNMLKASFLVADFKKIIPILLESAEAEAAHFRKIIARLDLL